MTTEQNKIELVKILNNCSQDEFLDLIITGIMDTEGWLCYGMYDLAYGLGVQYRDNPEEAAQTVIDLYNGEFKKFNMNDDYFYIVISDGYMESFNDFREQWSTEMFAEAVLDSGQMTGISAIDEFLKKVNVGE